MTELILASTSRSEDAGYLVLADVASVAEGLDADYRLVGGHMVSILVALHKVTDVPSRRDGRCGPGCRILRGRRPATDQRAD